MPSSFFAFLSRMKYIRRWSLMRNTHSENLAEHAQSVAAIAHALALIRRDISGGSISPERVAVHALYHDASEILTGDMPTPIKYHSPGLRDAYKEVERDAFNRLLSLLPEPLLRSYEEVVFDGDAEVRILVKAADRLSAYIKCLEERAAGNTEFSSAEKAQREALLAMKLPEVDYFLKEFIPAFSLTLDELQNR